MLTSLTTLTPGAQRALRSLVSTITGHDGISPINESAELGIDGARPARFLLAGPEGAPLGFAVVDERDATLMVGVHPEHRRRGLGTELLTAALEEHPDFAGWAFGTLPGAAELAARVGLQPVRKLLRMERDVVAGEAELTMLAGSAQASGSGPRSSAAARPGTTLDTYTPADAEQIVAVNAAAFAHHPEQGKLTVEEFLDLTRQPWFEPAGLILARHEGDIAGFHWTKRHGGNLGEVYVIAVSPEHAGKGLGRLLLDAGLTHLADQGDTRIQLYVEGDQERVVTMYRNAGFRTAQTDTSYRKARS